MYTYSMYITEHVERPPERVGKEKLPWFRGRLAARAAFWATFCSSFVLLWVLHGVSLEWTDGPPPPKVFANSQRALDECVWVSASVRELVECGAAYEVFVRPKVVSPLSVAIRDMGPEGIKKRLIWNGRYVNSFLRPRKFRYESLQWVRDLAFRGDRAWSFDLTSGYYHVELAKWCHTYVAFEWEGRYYCFAVLPFGLAIACYVFSTLTGELTKRWRSLGDRCIHYLDDWIFFGSMAGTAGAILLKRQAQVLRDLDLCGFLVNMKKSVFVPTHRPIFLGFGMDLASNLFFIPERRWTVFKALLGYVRSQRRLSARTVARVAGKAISFGMAFGKVSRMFTREMYHFIALALYWDHYMAITPEVSGEFDFWDSLSTASFSMPIWIVYSSLSDYVAHTDAGAIGWGGWIQRYYSDDMSLARGYLTTIQREQSSTDRELVAILQVLISFVHKVRGTSVKLYTDSQAAYFILLNGCSSVMPLHRLAVRLFWFCTEHRVALDVYWIPREENQLADYLAGIFDKDDWRLHTFFFRMLDRLWGPHGIDRFASHLNNLCPVFNSAWWCPGCSDVNCLSLIDWAKFNNWCNPPFRLIGQLLRVLSRQRAEATIIVPLWTKQHWWPLLVPDGVYFAEIVKDFRELDSEAIHGPDFVFAPGAAVANERGVGPPKFRVFAVRVSFKGGETIDSRRLSWLWVPY